MSIRYFSREADLPLTLGLLVDTSMSQRQVLDQERAASGTFLEKVMHEKDAAFLIHFDREVELLQDLTSSRSKLEDALAHCTQQRRAMRINLLAREGRERAATHAVAGISVSIANTGAGHSFMTRFIWPRMN